MGILGLSNENKATISEVTEEFGPRFRLAAILVDLDLPVNEPTNESSCVNICYYF